MNKSDVNSDNRLMTLHEMFRIIGDQLTARDVRVMKFMYSGVFTPEFLAQIRDGFSFLLALERIDRVDDSNFRTLENYLRIIHRHDLVQFLTLSQRKPVEADPVTEYLEKTARQSDLLVHTTSRNPEPKEDRLPGLSSETHTVNKPDTEHGSCSTCESALKNDNLPKSGTSGSSCVSPEKLHRSKNNYRSHKRTRSQVKLPDGGCVHSAKKEKKDEHLESTNTSNTSSSRDSPVVDRSRRKKSLHKVVRRRSKRLEDLSKVTEGSSGSSPEPRRTTNQQNVVMVQGQNDEPNNELQGVKHTPPKPSGDNSKEATQAEKSKPKCDIRLRVRAEYCSHQGALDGNVHSNKPDRIERQFEKFMQANTILKSRDLGSIICDIKFSELTYLDAFWRDYVNGSLLEALKGVFITESLKQAVGHEAIQLLVNVDEDDYEKGRLILLKGLQDEDDTKR